MRGRYRMTEIKVIMDRLLHHEGGQIMMATLVLLVVFSLISAPLLSFMATGVRAARVFQDKMEGYYAADAGIQDAVWQLRQSSPDPDKVPSNVGESKTYTLDQIINGAQVMVTITYENDTPEYKIVSSTSGSSVISTTVSSFVRSSKGLFGYAASALQGNVTVGNNAIVTSTSVNPSDPSTYNADLIAKGNINIEGNAKVYGDAIASGSISGDAQGAEVPNSDIPPESGIDTSGYHEQSKVITTSPVYPSSSYSNGGTITGSARLTGNLTIKNNKILTVEQNLYIDGNLSIGNGSVITIGGALYVNGYITTGNDGSLTVNGYLYSEGDVETGSNFNLVLKGTTYVNGSLTINNNSTWPQPVIVVAKEDITFNNNCQTTSGTSLFISETGNVNIQNNCEILVGYMYAPAGDINISNNVDVTGSLVAKNINIGNNAVVTFSQPTSSSILPEEVLGQFNIYTYSIS